MKFRRIALAAAVCAALGRASAADLVTIYRDSQVSDPVYQSARAQYMASLEKLPQARSAYLPLLAGSASVFRNYSERDGAPDRNFTTKTYAITLAQPIFRLQSWIAIDQAKQQVIQAEATLAGTQQDLILRVAQAYFDVLLAQDNVALSDTQNSAISEQLAQAKRNFEVGTATIVDTLEAQAPKTISDKNDLEVKRRALQVLIGKLPEGLTPLREPLQLGEPQPNDIEAWVTASLDSSYTIAAARASYEFFREEIARQRAGHLPTLDLSGSVARVSDPNSALPPVSINSNNASIGFTLSVPIYSGGLIQSRVREALANRDRAEQDLDNTQRTVAQAVRVNFLNVTSGIAQVRALLDSTILGRDVGVRTSVDVLNAQQSVFQTRRDLQQARYNFLMSNLRLKAAAGVLTETDLEEVNRTLARG